MLDRLISMLPDEKSRDVAATVGGMAALFAGRKVMAVTLFTRGVIGIEKQWRANNPDFEGGFKARWDRSVEFYDGTHQDKTNRWLHIVGIPMIVGGAAGLLAFPA